MAAVLFRRRTGLCIRCIHREMCRVIWRPQTAQFSSKPSDRKEPRRTHIKKAKPQPAVDVTKLLEQLFSQRRPATSPPAHKARPSKASSVPTKPATPPSMKISTSNVPPLLKTEPGASVFPAASSFKQLPKKTTSTFNAAPLSTEPNSTSTTNPKTSYSSQSSLDFMQSMAADSVSKEAAPPTSTGSEAAAIEWQTAAETLESIGEMATKEPKTATVLPLSAHMVERNVGTSPLSAAAAEPLIQATTESPAEPSLSTVETYEGRAAVVEGPVKHTADVSAEEVQIKDTDPEVVVAKEPLIETTIESPVENSHFPMATLETRADFAEHSLQPMIDVTVDLAADTKSPNSGVVDISYTASVEPLVETTVETSVEASTCPLETLENKDTVEGSVESTFETKADTEAQEVQTNGTGSGVLNISYTAGEPLIETTIEPAVEASTSPPESRAAVCECTVEPTIENEAADSLSHPALIQNAQESAPLNLKNQVESTVESSSGDVAVQEGATKSEQMTLESVTLHVVESRVESLEMDELLHTKSALDEKAEEQLQELLVQTEAGGEDAAAAETENSSEDESEILTKALSKWESLSEDLQEFEGESAKLVKELLYHVPGTVITSSASGPPAAIHGEPLITDEKGTQAEALTLESITLLNVRTEVGGLDTEVLLEAWNALDKEAEVLTKEEKMEVKTTVEDAAVFEDITEVGILTLDSISEATDAIEAETSFILEVLVGSKQGLRQRPDSLLVDQKWQQQKEAIDQDREAESREQDGSVLEAMTLEYVSLVEVETSLGTLETNPLSETTDDPEKEDERKKKVENGMVSEGTTEALKIESLSVPQGDALFEALQTDQPMEEPLFSIPGHAAGVTEGPTGQEVVRANIWDATDAAGSDEVDSAASVTDDCPDSPALKEVLLEQEVEEGEVQTEALWNEDGKLAHTDLDPVQRLFLEKISEYDNMCRLNEGLLEAEPDYKKHLSEETSKLQRRYGGGDLSSFPEFTFNEPKVDDDSK